MESDAGIYRARVTNHIDCCATSKHTQYSAGFVGVQEVDDIVSFGPLYQTWRTKQTRQQVPRQATYRESLQFMTMSGTGVTRLTFPFGRSLGIST